MKRVLVVLGAVLALATNSTAAHAAEQFRYTFSGESASAFFYSSTECSQTWLSVGATDGRVQAGPGQPVYNSAASVWLSSYDFCTGAYRDSYAYAELARDAFQMSQGGASLSATLTAYDWWAGSEVETFTVNLTWASTGKATQGMWHTVYRSASWTEVFRSNGTSRTASVSGSVQTSDGVAFDMASASAVLYTTQSGSVTVYKS